MPEPSHISGWIADQHGMPAADIRVEAVSGDRGPYPLPEPLPLLDDAEVPAEKTETALDGELPLGCGSASGAGCGHGSGG